MRVGIDFDDVLVDTNPSLLGFHNEQFGTAHWMEDVQSFDLSRLWGCTPDEAHERLEAWYYSSHHANLVPVFGAQEAVMHLANFCELHIITARHAHLAEVTSALVGRHFPDVFAGVHFVGYNGRGHGSKARACQELGVTILLEDAPHHAHAVAAVGIPVLLFDAPWNGDVAGDNIIRVHTWAEAVDHITRL